MQIDVNRVAAYLAGNFPPYYEQFSKLKFIKTLVREASTVFPEKEEFNFISDHSSSLQVFFKESLSLIEQEIVLEKILVELKIPQEAWSLDYIQVKEHTSKIEKINKTIGFITPFDKKHKKLQAIIQDVLDKDFKGWKIVTASLEKDGDGKFMWSTIDDFLEKYPVYLIDFRDKNLNVAMELGAILKSYKDAIVITEENLPTDISGYIYVKKPTVDMEDEGTKKAQEMFKSSLKKQLNRYLTD